MRDCPASASGSVPAWNSGRPPTDEASRPCSPLVSPEGVSRERDYPCRRVKVFSVVGNRPQFVKSAPLSVVLHTGQHWDREMSQVFFDELGLGEPRYRLDVRSRDVDAMLPGILDALDAERPDAVL